jgi:hypothetical protein
MQDSYQHEIEIFNKTELNLNSARIGYLLKILLEVAIMMYLSEQYAWWLFSIYILLPIDPVKLVFNPFWKKELKVQA